MKTTYEKFYRMFKLESLGEIIQQNLSEKEAVKSRELTRWKWYII